MMLSIPLENWKWVEEPSGYGSTDLMDGDRRVLSIYESHVGGDMPRGMDKRLIASIPTFVSLLLEEYNAYPSGTSTDPNKAAWLKKVEAELSPIIGFGWQINA